MAVVAKGAKPRWVTPSGQGSIFRGLLAADVAAGDLVVQAANGTYSTAPTGAVRVHGVALQTGRAGQTYDFANSGEMDGYSGMTPGAYLYPSATTAGQLDTTATASPNQPIGRAMSATRVLFNFV